MQGQEDEIADTDKDKKKSKDRIEKGSQKGEDEEKKMKGSEGEE